MAHKAVQLAHEGAAGKGPDDRAAHVGFYLIDKGLPQLERAAQVRLPAFEAVRRTCRRFPLLLYLGTITMIAVILAADLLEEADASGLVNWSLGLVGIVTLLCASQLAVALVNWLATVLATPHLLPRMDFSAGVPPESRTLVVIPTMLTCAQAIEGLIEALEVRFLANRTGNLHFGLLTDFQDARAESIPEDGPLLLQARNGIERLNASYPGANGDTFFLFHRPRRWNPQDKIWMGYERKRGKLADLNALLRGGAADRFSLVVGETTILASVKYVITLDTDTQLPRDAARQFIGAMAHPLNRARYDEARQLVSEGYGILQPRVAASLPGANRSRYARMCGAEAGIDPYTRAVSDVYQDLFREGSFVGKGIYDVEAFERALSGRFPENRILSHDLLEGCYARSGLLSDVHLYEEDPYSYSADVIRRSPLDSRRLADCALAAAGRSRRRRAPAEESALGTFPMEDLRQPAAQPGAGGIDSALAAGLDRAVAGVVLDPGGNRDYRDSKPDCLDTGVVSEAARRAAWPACRRRGALGGPPRLSSRIYARMPALRGLLQSRCNFAHGGANADYPNPVAGVDRVERTRLLQRRGSRCRFPIDVDRDGHRRRRLCRSGCGKAGRAGGGRADSGTVVFLSGHCLVDKPAAR